MADEVWKVQLLQNKIFDPSTPSMKKVDDRGKKGEKIILCRVATTLITIRPPECRTTGASTSFMPKLTMHPRNYISANSRLIWK